MPYSSVDEALKAKKEVKEKLAKEWGFSNKKPLLGIFVDEDIDKEDLEMLRKLGSGLELLDVEVVVLSDKKIEELKFATHVEYNMGNREVLLEACDVALAALNNDVEEMLMHGVIPVGLKREELEDYDALSESGNSFISKGYSHWEYFTAVVRALETFKFHYDWRHIVRNGLDRR